MDKAAHRLSNTVAIKVRPRYQGWLRRDMGASEAYSLAYDEVVGLVARAQHLTVEKARFASREVLQEAMQLITSEASR